MLARQASRARERERLTARANVVANQPPWLRDDHIKATLVAPIADTPQVGVASKIGKVYLLHPLV